MSKPQHLPHENTQHARVMNLKYKAKYKRIKQQIKDMVLENAALCDEVAEVQAELVRAREDRRFLIRRLMRHEDVEQIEPQQQRAQSRNEETATAKCAVPRKRGPKKRLTNASTAAPVDKTNKMAKKPRERITLDATGKPKFPLNLHNILLHSCGEIVSSNINFHNAHWIYPVGYSATRIFAHPRDPQRKCVYTCKILNNAGTPQFQIIPDADLDSVFFGDSANLCHQTLLETLQRSLDVSNLPLRVQGEKFFGLANVTVQSLLQMDANFKLCTNFKGFLQPTDEDFGIAEEQDATMNFDALQAFIAKTVYHTMPEVKEEPPDELLDFK